MSNNKIAHIPNGALQGLVSLRTLDLSGNELEKLDNKTHGLLDDCFSIERVNLSNNKITFISRKMFPSNPYIPYNLKNIDLSYNNVPLVTYDFVFGTSKVETLNLTHNSIADIRRYVLGNLTSLRTLDLSFNLLEDITSDPDVFILPKSISEINLSHNMLNELPWREVIKVENLTTLDLQHNNFTVFTKEMNTLVNNKTRILLKGNALTCDCFARPMRRYFDTLLEVPQFYKDVICSEPEYINGKPLFEVWDDGLFCPKDVNLTKSEQNEYEVAADVKIRDLKMIKDDLTVSWSVIKNEDIADPYVVIRGIKNAKDALYAKTLPYFQRKLELNIFKENLAKIKSSRRDYEICVVARNSLDNVRNFFQNQCRGLDTTNGTARYVSWNIYFIFVLLLVNYLF
ncbi:chondroadherin-like protein [Photinus pyralis]|nr:chondroadherin-like protein [Photinus pyralis]